LDHLAYLLSSHYGLGAGVAGSFGLVGAAGALVAPVAGQDGRQARHAWVLTSQSTLIAFSYLCCGPEWPPASRWRLHIAALVVASSRAGHRNANGAGANQTRIFGLVPSARSRLNTVYMTLFFVGGRLDRARNLAGTLAVERVCLLALD